MISDASDSSPSAEAAARCVSGQCLSTAARTADMIGKELGESFTFQQRSRGDGEAMTEQ
jgi:hypothetical protein